MGVIYIDWWSREKSVDISNFDFGYDIWFDLGVKAEGKSVKIA